MNGAYAGALPQNFTGHFIRISGGRGGDRGGRGGGRVWRGANDAWGTFIPPTPASRGNRRKVSDQVHHSPYKVHDVYSFKDRGRRSHVYIAADSRTGWQRRHINTVVSICCGGIGRLVYRIGPRAVVHLW